VFNGIHDGIFSGGPRETAGDYIKKYSLAQFLPYLVSTQPSTSGFLAQPPFFLGCYFERIIISSC